MFAAVSNASKAAFIALVVELVPGVHARRLPGAYGAPGEARGAGIPRADFWALLADALKLPTLRGKWGALMDAP